VMPILEISPSRISVRAHIRALTRRLLGPSGRRSHPPADADLPDPKVRDRAGVPPSSLIWLSEAAGWGRAEIRLRKGHFESQLASRLSGYATPAAIGTFGSEASRGVVEADELCSIQIPRIGLMIIPQSTAMARLRRMRTP
jgi:hypothetical protein